MVRGKAGAIDESQVLARIELHEGHDVRAAARARDEAARRERDARREGSEVHVEVSTVTLRGSIDEERGLSTMEHVATGLAASKIEAICAAVLRARRGA